jgi:hypothetical protein
VSLSRWDSQSGSYSLECPRNDQSYERRGYRAHQTE